MGRAQDAALKPGRAGPLILASWVLSLAGLAGWGWFLDVPWIRSSAAPAWVGVLLGAALALRAMGRRPAWPLAVAAMLQILLCAAFVSWMLWFSRLPGTELLDGLQRAPDFSLEDQDGTAVTLASRLAGGPVLLVFFRGWW